RRVATKDVVAGTTTVARESNRDSFTEVSPTRIAPAYNGRESLAARRGARSRPSGEAGSRIWSYSARTGASWAAQRPGAKLPFSASWALRKEVRSVAASLT